MECKDSIPIPFFFLITFIQLTSLSRYHHLKGLWPMQHHQLPQSLESFDKLIPLCPNTPHHRTSPYVSEPAKKNANESFNPKHQNTRAFIVYSSVFRHFGRIRAQLHIHQLHSSATTLLKIHICLFLFTSSPIIMMICRNKKRVRAENIHPHSVGTTSIGRDWRIQDFDLLIIRT